MRPSIPILLALSLLLALSSGVRADAPQPQVSSGRLQAIDDLPWQHIPPRPLWVWLPDGYPQGGPYAVLYMHDGQMLFDARTTWNGQEWRADEVASSLIAGGETRPFLIVAVGNGDARRHVEYFPQRAFESLAAAEQQRQYAFERSPGVPLYAGKVDSDAYLRFLVEELKPYIDSHFAVRRDRANTVVLGSSMGGLISLYALSEYPQVFGAAGCLSTHWPGSFEQTDNPLPAAFFDYIDAALPPAGAHRLYFDHGDATLDAAYPPLQAQADARIRAKGYGDRDWVSRFFPGAEHSENAWAARLAIPLRFLLPPDPQAP